MVNLLAVLLLACALLSATRVIAQEMEFRGASNGGNCVSCGWVAGEGEITADTPKRLLDFVSENYTPKTIVLNSPGGSVIGGIGLGRLIREIGANTSVGDTKPMEGQGLERWETIGPGRCASSCVFAFMGGEERDAYDGELGVHQIYSINRDMTEADVQYAIGAIVLHAVDMGVDAGFLAKVLTTSSEEMRWLTEEEALASNLATQEFFDYRLDWKIEPYGGGFIIAATDKRLGLRDVAVTLFCRQQDERWRVLITESDPSYVSGLPAGLFEQNPQPRSWSESYIQIGDKSIRSDPTDYEFFRIDSGSAYLSIVLPIDLPKTAAREGVTLSVQHELPSYLNDAFHIDGQLPPLLWLEAVGKACI